MADQYIGEIRYFTYLRGAPSGWLLCDGSTPSVQDYQELFALLGTTYGGDGQNTFGLPDLRGRVAIGAGGSYPLGNVTGSETVQLNSNQIPTHQHAIVASLGPAESPGTAPNGEFFANNVPIYTLSTTATAMSDQMIGSTGQGLPHENCAPTQALQVCICAEGVWPVNPN